ncbi:MAG TPA: PAS domain S-box protein [Bryobacteraceae bacterium]|nr:PAS domain S-box protein [Bryobacteraceae bacterium]HOQ44450.1 PAS domain S-box protein [Bryobacteraceae bacterium]HPU70769.1 PAS domain S-box protein [Bryobacteraceae bacterium]
MFALQTGGYGIATNHWSRFKPYAWAILGTTIAVILRLLLVPVLGNPLFYGILYVAVVASAVYGGLGPAIVATMLGAVTADLFTVPPHWKLQIHSAEDQLSLAIYLLISAALIAFAERQRRTRAQRAAAAERAENEAVRVSEQRFRRLVEVSSQTVWMANAEGEPYAVLSSLCPTSGREEEKRLVPSNWLDAVHPEDRPRVVEAWRMAVASAAPFKDELRFKNASGEYRYISCHAAPVFNEDGSIREWIGMSADITDRRRAERALAEAMQRLDAHMDNSPLAVVEFDPQFRITRWSAEAYKMFGWRADEVMGRAIHEIRWVHEDDVEAVNRVARSMTEGRRPRNLQVSRNYRKDGSVLECEWYNSAIYDKEGNLSSILSQVLDITGRKRAEEKLRQSQKMESIAVLAGGLAHDFNNLLVGIIGNASLALEMLEPGSPAEDLIQRIIKTGERAAHLTSQMLAYSGKGRFVVEPVNLSALVREVAALVRPSTPKGIAISLDLDPELPGIRADRGQMHQVVMNLLINATEAIGERGGSVELRTGVLESGEGRKGEMEALDLPPGKYVFLEVCDTGLGMDAATKAKIFEPFFTTKFTGRGLGLAAVSGIVRGHEGAIKVISSPGKGSCFRVLLPAEVSAGNAQIPAPESA